MTLKHCPFCGSKHVYIRTTYYKNGLSNVQFEIYCSKCSANGGSRTDEQKAIKVWNSRVDNLVKETVGDTE